jgi:Tol biopolymer transport system component
MASIGRGAAILLASALVAASCTSHGTGATPSQGRTSPPGSPTPPVATVRPLATVEPNSRPEALGVGHLAFIAAARGDRVLVLKAGGRVVDVPVGPRIALVGLSISSKRQVAYAVGLSEGRATIRVVNDTGGPRRFTVPPVGADQFPAWSPSGSEIAFSDGLRIDVFDTATSRVTPVTTPPGPCNDSLPTWWPGGTRLAFFRDCDPGTLSGIYESRVRGGAPVRILRASRNSATKPWPGTSIRGLPTGLSWSPDGASIALATPDGSLWLVPAKIAPASQGPALLNGSNLPLLVGSESPQPTGERFGAVSWSPDGREIAFIRGGSIFVINPSTRSVRPMAGTVGLHPIAISWG